MPKHSLESHTATFLHAIYSPKGGIEGMLVELDGERTQFAFKHEPSLEEIVAFAQEGDLLDVEVERTDPGDKGDPAHPVYRLASAALADAAPGHDDAVQASTTGVVARLNYALHGEPNGVVLDNGDFVHLRPPGMHQAGLSVGDRVEARGPGRRLRFGPGRVIEAQVVNGLPVERAKPAGSPRH